MILRKDFQRNQTSEKQTENRMGNHTVIIKKRYNAIYRRSSKKEHRADALALRADERRDKLRKAMGRSKYPLIHGSLNGETRLDRLQSSMRQSITHGGGGPRSFRQGFSCLVLLWIPLCQSVLRLRGFHPLWPAFPKPFCWTS